MPQKSTVAAKQSTPALKQLDSLNNVHNKITNAVKGELNSNIKSDLNDSFCTLINKYNPHIF